MIQFSLVIQFLESINNEASGEWIQMASIESLNNYRTTCPEPFVQGKLGHELWERFQTFAEENESYNKHGRNL